VAPTLAAASAAPWEEVWRSVSVLLVTAITAGGRAGAPAASACGGADARGGVCLRGWAVAEEGTRGGVGTEEKEDEAGAARAL